MAPPKESDSSTRAAAREHKGEGKEEQREDVLASVRRLLELLEKPREKVSRASAVLNSALTVTVLGGICVALIGWLLQTMTSHHDKEMVEAKQARDNKEKVAFDFANSFPQTLDLASRYRSRELWLEEYRGRKKEARYADDRTYDETQRYYEGLVDQYLSRPPLASSYNQVIAVFTNESVIRYASNLFSSFQVILTTTNREEIKVRFRECDEEYKELTKFMFQEVLQIK